MYGLLIKGGRVIDAAQNLDDELDVAINGHRIASVAKDIPSSNSRQLIDARGKVITPGLIDLHCHVYYGVLNDGVHPDDAGVRQGVTTVNDGGSAGHAILGGFRKYVIPMSRTTVYCFIHLGSRGLSVAPDEIRDWEEINVDATSAAIESNLDIIKGVKIRIDGNIFAGDVEVMKKAKQVASKYHLPVMVHLGDRSNAVSPALTRKYIERLESGDILSHIYTPLNGCPLNDDGTVMPEIREAVARGVIMDTANGRANCSWDVAQKCIEQEFLPSTISTDVLLPSLSNTVYGLTVTMSAFMALGLDLKQIVAMTTINPARALGIDNEVGSLKAGMNADVSILELTPGTWKLTDARQSAVEVKELIDPFMTVKQGQIILAQPVARPQQI